MMAAMAKRTAYRVTAGDFRGLLCDLAGSREVTNAELCRLAEARLGVSYNMAYRYVTGRAPVPVPVLMLINCRLGHTAPQGFGR